MSHADVDDIQPGLGRREAGKARRRQQIIQAARELIRETGDSRLSMRALAERAGVSLATAYNLFGSRRAIVLALLQDIREFHERFSTLRVSDPLERIFGALAIVITFYVDDASFYRTLWSAVFDISEDVRAAIFTPKRDVFWDGLIAAARDAGALVPETNPTLVRVQLDYMLRAVMLDWVAGRLSSERLLPTITFGYALVLNGLVATEWRGPMRIRMLDAQAHLNFPPGPSPTDAAPASADNAR